jgi:nicotinamidase/pyrazinamidase
MKTTISPHSGDALVIVDLQTDFLPGGALAVPHGDEVIPALNHYIALFEQRGLPIFATRDWHPANHCSFQGQGGPWPQHCVMFSQGAEFSPRLKLPASAIVISKPSVADRETYSAFEGTDFAERLREMKCKRLFIGGLATDYCVLNTVLGALESGFEVFLLCDAIAAVNARPDNGRKAEEEMFRRGAMPIELHQLPA